MATNKNMDCIYRLFDEAYTKGNLSVCDEIFASSIALNDPAAPSFRGNVDKYKQMENIYKTALANKKANIDDIWSFDDKVLVKWTVTGVHKGKLGEIAPSNKSVKITGISIYKFNKAGKIEEICQNWDRLGLLEQVGALERLHALH